MCIQMDFGIDFLCNVFRVVHIMCIYGYICMEACLLTNSVKAVCNDAGGEVSELINAVNEPNYLSYF